MTSVARAAAPSPPQTRAASELLPRRPYPGLRPFEKAEWPIFRGRDRLIQNILTILAESHFASVIGPSGSGKSSLVRAGVLAALERRHSRMGVRWRTATMRPGASPLWSMADGILRTLRPELIAPDGELPAEDVARLRVLIQSGEDGLAAVTRELGLEENENLLLLVDQFEEIFRFQTEAAGREGGRLAELLVAVARQRPPGFYIITTMRSEYLGDCARFTGLAETLNETHYLLPRMTDAELRQAIVEPAELKNGRIEDALIERLIDDVRAQEDQLPILQHTLLWMWIQEEERREREGLEGDAGIQLGLAEYEQLQAGRNAGQGEVKSALTRHGDKILDELSAEERRIAEVMFRRLVEVAEHSNRLRRPTRCGTVQKLADVPLDLVQRVVDAFRAEDASFIYASRQHVTADTSIDITHESLIRHWDTLDRWVRREKASYEVYDDLCRAAQRMRDAQGTLLTGLALSRALHWLYEERPTRLWARRYGGDFDTALRFLNASEEADEQRRREQQAAEEAARRQEEERVRLQNELEQQALRARLERQGLRTRLAVAAAVVGGILTALATGTSWYAHEQKVRADTAAEQALAEARRADAAAVETKASSLWSRLQLWRDPLPQEDVRALWDLAGEDEKVRVQFVRQLAADRGLLGRFGRNPTPLARAVGLRWPEEARQVAQQRVDAVATEQFNFETADPFELTAYVRAVLALARRDYPIPDATKGKIDTAIRNLSGQVPDSKTLLALAQIADAVGESATPEVIVAPETLAAARDTLRDAIVSAKPNQDRFRDLAVSRAIEVMAPYLGPSERTAALAYQLALLGKQVDTPWAPITPRAILALLPTLEPGEAPDLPKTLLHAVVATAAAKSDSSYLLALMQIVETVSATPEKAAGASFVQALVDEFADSGAVRRAALARAAIPLVEQRGDGASALVPFIADATFGGAASGELDDQLTQALLSPDADRRSSASQAVMSVLLNEWTTKWPATATLNKRSDLYRWSAQARLIATLAPVLTSASATDAMNGVLLILDRPGQRDYLAGEAMARALEALAPRLPESARPIALSPAKAALAGTGSSEEAIAWTRAIIALLPADRDAFTHAVIEVLKYPTASGAPTEVLLAALASRWPGEDALKGKTLADRAVLSWLEAHLPDGQSLTAPPARPAGLESADAAPEPG
jgi:hypothetical protein